MIMTYIFYIWIIPGFSNSLHAFHCYAVVTFVRAQGTFVFNLTPILLNLLIKRLERKPTEFQWPAMDHEAFSVLLQEVIWTREQVERSSGEKVKAIWHSVFSPPSLNMDVSYLWDSHVMCCSSKLRICLIPFSDNPGCIFNLNVCGRTSGRSRRLVGSRLPRPVGESTEQSHTPCSDGARTHIYCTVFRSPRPQRQ